MRYVFAAWALPLLIFWGWYFLSYNDMNFGFTMLTRDVHNLVFQIYGNILGLDPQSLPLLVAKACVFDTLIILAIWAFRRRRQIASWVRQKINRNSDVVARRYAEAASSRSV